MDRWVCDSTGVTCSLTLSRICDSTGVSVGSSLTLSTRPSCWCWWTGEVVATRVSASPVLWHCLPDHTVCADNRWVRRYISRPPALWYCLAECAACADEQVNFYIQVSVLHMLFDICLPEHAAWADGQVSFFAYRYQCFTCSLIFVYQSMLLGLMDRWVFLHTGISASPALWYLSTRACCLGWWTGEFFCIQVSVLHLLFDICLPEHAAWADGQVSFFAYRYQCFTCSLIFVYQSMLLGLMDRWVFLHTGISASPAVWYLSTRACCLGWWTGEFLQTGIRASPALWYCLAEHCWLCWWTGGFIIT